MKQVRLAFNIGLAALMLLGGLQSCGPKSGGMNDGRSSGTSSGGGSKSNDRLVDPIDNPLGTSSSAWVKTGNIPLGSVPYDNMNLPLVSPDGKYVATQMGVAPKWPTLLAQPGAELPMLTSIGVYQLDRRENIALDQIQPPRSIAEVNDMILLGRSCDEQGFLVESPREDGSRWIGKVSWIDGSMTWLVEGADVNAFASLGPLGQLAWCRRPAAQEHFELVVRTGSGEWSIPSSGDDWLMPTWSGRDHGLFVFNLIGSQLQLRFAPASNSGAFSSMLQTLTVVNDAQVYHVYQAVIGQAGAIPVSTVDQLAYFHPGLKRMAVWRPMARAGQRNIALAEKSNAALVDDDIALVSLEDELVQQSVLRPRASLDIASGLYVARGTPAAPWPILLLKPGQDRVSLTALKLLSPDELTSASNAR